MLAYRLKGKSLYKLCHCFTSSQTAYRFFLVHFKYFSTKNFKLTVILPNDGFYSELVDLFPQVEFKCINFSRRISIYKDIASLLSLINFFRKKKFDIVQMHTPKASMLCSIAAKLCRQKKIVYHLHGFVSVNFNQFKKGIPYFFELIPFKLSDYVISVSHSMTEFFVEKGIVSNNKILTIHNGSASGIDTSYKYNRSRLAPIKKKSFDFEIGFVGRLNFDKGLKDFIFVCNKLSAKHHNIKVTIVGESELTEVESDIWRGLTSIDINFVGVTESPEEYMINFDILLFPSVREGFGSVIAECAALAVPTVGYNIFGVSSAVKINETGILVEPGNKWALLDAVEEYYSNTDLLHKHGRAAESFIKECFQPSDVLHSLHEFYFTILEKNR